MSFFEVNFYNNIAVSAKKVPTLHSDSVIVEQIDGSNVIRSLTIFADDELESIKVANDVYSEYFRFLCK